ncbi:MAG: alpha/beta hydrolase [Brevinematales bacterium]|nr:alpha/beta hydrolase [Brevinematales bacterium]
MIDNKIFKVDKDRFISYFEIGKGKEVLLFIHGWLTSKESWIPVIQNIDKRKYKIIAIDMLGHGQSSRSLKLNFNTSENIYILTRFIVSLGLNNVILIGHSTGGKISLFLANKLYEISKTLVKKVIIVNSIGSYEFWRLLHPILKISFWKPIRFLIGIFTIPLFIKFYFKNFLFFLPISDKVKENISKYLSDYTSIHFNSLRNKICALRITKNLFDMFVEDIDRSMLPDVEIIWSHHDKLVPIQVQYKFSKIFKKPVYIISEGGHMTPIEIPEKLASIIDHLAK